MTKQKDLAEAIYRINPFDVVGKEGRAIATVAEAFRNSSAPEFMLQSLMDDLRDVARRKAHSRTKDKEIWRNIHSFLKKPMTP
jgi:hypothetical protein